MVDKHLLKSILARVPLLSPLCEEELSLLSDSEDCLLVTAERGELHVGRALCILTDGSAQILSSDPDRNVVLRTLTPPDMFGAASLFSDKGELSRIITDTGATLLVLSEGIMRTLLERDRALMYRYLSFLAGRVEFLNRKIRCFTAGSAERRLALWLAGEQKEHFCLPGSLTTLADMLNVGRASLYRAFDRLSAEGLIEKNGREIIVTDRDALLKQYE
ncbi:MAG: Crp/Fnr family transcriptional regulator [Ruminococcaceae bacterium]|nr:Crp/Fnr family transcriptional regulator [Oscillospiraceae bacterium]